MPSNRKLMWIVRLVFYPVSIGLIVLAWQQRGGDEPEAAPWSTHPVQRIAAPGVTTVLQGKTEHGHGMRLELRDGRPIGWDVDSITLWCGSRPGRGGYVGFSYRQFVHSPQDVVAGTTLRTRREGVSATWGNGWSATAKVNADARMGEDGLRGTLRVVARMNPPLAARVCRSGPVGFYLTRTNPPA